MAFLLPIIDYIIQSKVGLDKATNRDSPYAIIVSPTHELTMQIAADTSILVGGLISVNVAFAHGQLDSRDSLAMLKKGCDILVITAGRLYDYFGMDKNSDKQVI
jgi:superfamily II DNA/RNA helicase